MRKYLILGLSLLLLAAPGCAKKESQQPAKQEQPQAAQISENETNPEVWGKKYPAVWATWQKMREQSSQYSKYGGSEKKPKYGAYPYLKEIYAGNPFGEDYNEERSHFYAIEDVKDIKRKKPGGTCLTCKSPEVPKLIKEMGTKFYSDPFDQVVTKTPHAIGCSDCHDPKTMKLRITRPHLIEALKKQGKDPNKLSESDLKNYVCAQCHVEYYFEKDTKVVKLPWDKGMKPQNLVEYYNSINLEEWVHKTAGASLVKIQHPDFEFTTESTHAKAGATCADCHMPKIKEGGKEVVTHHMTTPGRYDFIACKKCHQQSGPEMKAKVIKIQDEINAKFKTASNDMIAAIKALEAASKSPKVDQAKLKEARGLYREADIYWDWMTAENSMGFHNPTEGNEYLDKASSLAKKATETANTAK